MKFNYKASICACIAMLFTACQQHFGTAWYPQSANSRTESKGQMYITEITVGDRTAKPFKLSKNPTDPYHARQLFSDSDTYTVSVPFTVEKIDKSIITVTAVTSLTHRNKLEGVELSLLGGKQEIHEEQTISVSIKLKKDGYSDTIKTINITRQNKKAAQKDLQLQKLMLCGIDIADKSEMEVPYSKAAITNADIEACFITGKDTNGNSVSELLAASILPDGKINLKAGVPTEITIQVKEAEGQYNAFTRRVSVTRKQKGANDPDVLTCRTLTLFGAYSIASGNATIPPTEKITAENIIGTFAIGEEGINAGVLDIRLKDTEGNDVSEISCSGKDSTRFTVYILDGTYTAFGKSFKHHAWEQSVLVTFDSNIRLPIPKDAQGTAKREEKVRRLSDDIDPFTHYTADYIFPASTVENWVVYISSFENNLPGYTFKQGSWTTDGKYTGEPSFGSSFTKVSNVCYYRYKNRKERWTSTDPKLYDEEKEKRFLFYRFTGTTASPTLDNSLFCVDTHSKFLFYYSDPATFDTIFGSKVPKNWTDYNEPSTGEHTEFKEPFYMSDPVGYVEQDGSVILYDWIKENIKKNNYKAQKDSNFKTPAARNIAGEGYSPYRYPIKKNFRTEVEITENSSYTAAQPEIIRQPKAIRMNPSSGATATFNIRVAPVPDDETLSYQWYKNNEQSAKNGSELPNGTEAEYTADASAAEDCYVYCIVTNTCNGKQACTTSDAVRFLVKEGELALDAAQPNITTQPENADIPMHSKKQVTLTVQAESPDGGSISYQWYEKSEEHSETPIDNATSASYTFTPDDTRKHTKQYYCCVTNTNNGMGITGKTHNIRNSNIVTVQVEEAYKVTFAAASAEGEKEGRGSVMAICNGKAITAEYLKALQKNNDAWYVKKGETITLVATPLFGSRVQKENGWQNITTTAENNTIAWLTVTKDTDVITTFEKIPHTLTIGAKEFKNVDVKWNDSNACATYFTFLCNAKVNNISEPLWNIHNGEKAELLDDAKPLKKEQTVTNEKKTATDFYTLPSDSTKVSITAQIASMYSNIWSSALAYFAQIVAKEDTCIPITYNAETGRWCYTEGTKTVLLNKKDHKQNKCTVTATYPDDFSIGLGETKEFTVSYKVAGATNGNGTVQITYFIGWQ